MIIQSWFFASLLAVQLHQTPKLTDFSELSITGHAGTGSVALTTMPTTAQVQVYASKPCTPEQLLWEEKEREKERAERVGAGFFFSSCHSPGDLMVTITGEGKNAIIHVMPGYSERDVILRLIELMKTPRN